MTTSHPQPTRPSGRQIEITHADQRAWIVEVGGSLRAYQVGDHDVLDGYSADERCTAARGQSLIPWPNRLRDGRYRFADRDHQLPLTEPDKRNDPRADTVGELDPSRSCSQPGDDATSAAPPTRLSLRA